MTLTVHDPSGARARVPFRGESLSVGRQDGNDILLPAPDVSRRHCRFSKTAGGIEVEDLGSTGGVRVDGAAIAGRVAVLPGQLVAVGPYLLVIEDADMAALPHEPLRPHWRLEVQEASNDVVIWSATRRASGR